MLKKIIQRLQQPFTWVVLLTLITIAITAQSLLLGNDAFGGSIPYTHYNNYVIFKQSFFHLINGQDLYELYPYEHYDYYKYSPTFSLLMAPLAYLPDGVGLFLWNGLNVLVLCFALWKFPFSSYKIKALALAFILIELITSIQNSQSNALIAGLIVLSFIFLEKEQIVLATLCIVLTVFIKLFGVVAFAIFLFYPNKIKSVLYSALWLLLLALLPLIIVPCEQLLFLYQSWLHLLVNDHNASYGLSVSGWLQTWFHLDFMKNMVVVIGALLFCVPLIKINYYKELRFKILYLASVLLWIVIFNHKAESPTFIIAITGAAIWFFTQQETTVSKVLLALAILFTMLSPTDIFPKLIREQYVVPYVLKAVPCILMWIKITYELMIYGNDNKYMAR